MNTTKNYRLMVVSLACIAVVLNSASRVVLSVAIVAMTNRSESNTGNGSQDCQELERQVYVNNSLTSTDGKTGEFDWETSTQGFILSAISYGYITTQIPGGMLAGRFGGRKVLGISLLAAGLLYLLVPVAAEAGVGVLIALQVLIGMVLGVDFPAIQSMVGRLAPVMERTKLASIALQGAPLGRLIFLPVAGALSDSSFLGGWPSVFYVTGALMLMWCIPWFLLVRENQPSNNNLENVGKARKPIPWKQILMSGPVWAIVFAHMCYAWLNYTLNAFLPTYLAQILKYTVAENGLIAAIPQLSSWLMQALSGPFVDCLRRRHLFSTTVARKLFTTLGLFLPALCLSLIYLGGCDRALVVTIISLVTGTSGLTMGGFLVNHIDVANHYAGELMGVTNTMAGMTGFIAPMTTGFIINDHPTRFTWQIVFFTCAAIYAFGGILYLCLGTGSEQTWNTQTIDIAEREPLLKKVSESVGSIKR